MDENREGDVRVPLISSLFCIFVLTGGVFLVLYVFFPAISQPWFSVVALILIGSPWIFWFMTYMYTCAKACCRRSTTTTYQDQFSRRGGSINNNHSVAPQNATKDGGSPVTSPNGGGKHVHFGEVVVMEGDENSRAGTDHESVSSSKEIEMPLNKAPMS